MSLLVNLLQLHTNQEFKHLIIALEERLKGRQPEFVKTLEEICMINSGSYDPDGLAAAATWIKTRMEAIGMEVTVNAESVCGVLKCTLPQPQSPILLLGHYDTVYSTVKCSDFPVRVEAIDPGETWVYGLGVGDMKGAVAAALEWIETALAVGWVPQGDIRFLVVGDEEILKPVRANEDAIRDISSNCIAAFGLEGARESGAVVSARSACYEYKVIARGKAAHAGTHPYGGANAISAMSHVVCALQRRTWRTQRGLKWGWPVGTLINPGVIKGGLESNVIPDFCEMLLDVRAESEEGLIKLIKIIKGTLRRVAKKYGAPLSFDLISQGGRLPFEATSESARLMEEVSAVGNLLGLKIGSEATGGAADIGICKTPRKGDGFGLEYRDDHNPELERILLESYSQRGTLLIGLLWLTWHQGK